MKSEQIEKGELENGFKYCIRNLSYFKEFVVMALVIRTGSISECNDEKGISHLIEHISMSFCSFDLVPEINYRTKAYTDYNETIFYIKCASNFTTVKKCLSVYKNIIEGKYFKQQYFEYAQKDVLEEIEAKKTEKKLLIELLLHGSSYLEHLAIGNSEIIRSMSLQKIIKFYKKHYSANKMILIMVGDIQKYDDIKDHIQTNYNSVRSDNKKYINHKFVIPEYTPKYFIERKDKDDCMTEIDVYFRIEKQKVHSKNDIKREIIEKIVIQIILGNFNIYLGTEKIIEAINFSHMDLDMFYMFYIVKVEIHNNRKIGLKKLIKEIEDYPLYLLSHINDIDMYTKKEQFFQITRDAESYYEDLGVHHLLMECIDHYILDKTIYTYEEKCKQYETLSRKIANRELYNFLEKIINCSKFYYIKE